MIASEALLASMAIVFIVLGPVASALGPAVIAIALSAPTTPSEFVVHLPRA